jgi:integrase
MSRASWSGFRSALAAGFTAFLAHKRALGRRYLTEERDLRLFDRFLAAEGVSTVAALTPALVEQFLLSRPGRQPRSVNALRAILRLWCAWLVAQGVLAANPVQVPPLRTTARREPFLFTPEQAACLLACAGALPDGPRAPHRGATYRTAFGLQYALGLRVGEVSRLRRGDVDLGQRVLTIRASKFGKDRLVPFGPRVAALLEAYLARRAPAGLPPAAPVFSFTARGAVHPGTFSQTFHHLVACLDLSIPPGVAPPRLHGLRHAFAVGTLLRWYRTGVDPAGRLFQLAAFLGHVNPSSTAVYLTITAPLLAEASQRFARLARGVLGREEVAP